MSCVRLVRITFDGCPYICSSSKDGMIKLWGTETALCLGTAFPDVPTMQFGGCLGVTPLTTGMRHAGVPMERSGTDRLDLGSFERCLVALARLRVIHSSDVIRRPSVYLRGQRRWQAQSRAW
jgi:hypothetical protein